MVVANRHINRDESKAAHSHSLPGQPYSLQDSRTGAAQAIATAY